MLHGSILPVSCVPPVTSECPEHSNEVKPLQPTCHILLCSYRAEDGQDVLDAWHSLEWQQFTHCEITHLIFSDDRDLLDIMILLDQVRHGFFTAVFISPPAATWSRLRNSQVPGQVPLRSRQCPLGMMSLSPESQSKVRASNFSLEVSSWFAEQILTSPQPQTFFLLVFPEDFGGDSCTGPASPWSAREFTNLSDAVEAQRGAVYLCRFAGAEYRRSVGLLTNVHSLSSDMYLGWPSLNTRDGVLHYSGPLPVTCACTKAHESLRGLAKKGGFKSFSAQSLGSRFWARILGRMQVSQLHAPLRDGAYSGQSSSAGSTYAGAKVPYGFALSAAPESAAALYEAWKGNTLTRAILRDYSSARLDNFFESRALARDAVALFSLLSSACVFLSSRLSSGLRVSSGRYPLRASSSPCVPVVAEFPLGSSISGEIADFSGFSPAVRGKEIVEDCPAPGDGKVSTQSLQPAGRVSIQSLQRLEPAVLDTDELDTIGVVASIPGIGPLSTSSRPSRTSETPPVRGRPGGSDGNGHRSSPAALPASSDFSSLDR